MKIRTITVIAVAIMLVSLFTVTAMAASEQSKKNYGDHIQEQKKDGSCLLTTFIDEDNNGVCDNFVDEDDDGICDNCQGDGVCDGDCDGVPDRLNQKLRNGSCQE